MRITLERSRQIFGNPLPPKTVWEKQFDGFQDELESVARKDWRKITGEDLNCYFYDLTWLNDLQPDLFQYLFPACLNYWYESLMQNQHAGSFPFTDLHDSLYCGGILERMVTPNEREAIYNFFHDGLIDRIEAERGFIYTGSSTPAYTWMSRFFKLGYLAPIIDQIWTTWWTLDHPGKAVSAIMYASGLVYLKGENPIFGEWTPEQGGGGPYITGGGYPWYEENRLFFEQTLSVQYIQEKLQEADQILCTEPEASLAQKVAEDALERAEIIEMRLEDLIVSIWTGESQNE